MFCFQIKEVNDTEFVTSQWRNKKLGPRWTNLKFKNICHHFFFINKIEKVQNSEFKTQLSRTTRIKTKLLKIRKSVTNIYFFRIFLQRLINFRTCRCPLQRRRKLNFFRIIENQQNNNLKTPNFFCRISQ